MPYALCPMPYAPSWRTAIRPHSLEDGICRQLLIKPTFALPIQPSPILAGCSPIRCRTMP